MIGMRHYTGADPLRGLGTSTDFRLKIIAVARDVAAPRRMQMHEADVLLWRRGLCVALDGDQ
jgi:hypothetical protein